MREWLHNLMIHADHSLHTALLSCVNTRPRKEKIEQLFSVHTMQSQAQLVFVIPEKSPTFATNKGSLSLLWCVCLWPVCSKSLVKSSMVFFKLALLTCPPSPVEIPTIVILGRRGFGGNWLTDSPSELSVLVKERGVRHEKLQKATCEWKWKQDPQPSMASAVLEQLIWILLFAGWFWPWIWKPVSKGEAEIRDSCRMVLIRVGYLICPGFWCTQLPITTGPIGTCVWVGNRTGRLHGSLEGCCTPDTTTLHQHNLTRVLEMFTKLMITMSPSRHV